MCFMVLLSCKSKRTFFTFYHFLGMNSFFVRSVFLSISILFPTKFTRDFIFAIMRQHMFLQPYSVRIWRGTNLKNMLNFYNFFKVLFLPRKCKWYFGNVRNEPVYNVVVFCIFSWFYNYSQLRGNDIQNQDEMHLHVQSNFWLKTW